MILLQKLSGFAKTFRSALLTRWQGFSDSELRWRYLPWSIMAALVRKLIFLQRNHMLSALVRSLHVITYNTLGVKFCLVIILLWHIFDWLFGCCFIFVFFGFGVSFLWAFMRFFVCLFGLFLLFLPHFCENNTRSKCQNQVLRTKWQENNYCHPLCNNGRIIGVDSGTALKRAGRSNYLRANEVRHRVIAGSAKSRLGLKKRQMQAYKKW